jgi:RNA polymerase sigma-70 factor (ECF subfamily)
MAVPHAEVLATVPAAPPPEVPASFAEIYDGYFAFVWRSARRLGAPALTVDDVVQETFVIAHRRLAEFEGRSSLKTWLFGIVLNVVRAHRRSLLAKHPHALRSEATTDLEGVRDAAPGPHEIATQAEAVRLVDQLLEALDEDKREVFVLAELEQMSAPEIATAIGVPVNTVYSRLRLARQEFAAAAARHRARDERRMP